MSKFLEITSNDNWFKLHPEKIAGVEYETTSFYFPIMVKGTKEDVYRVTGIKNPITTTTPTNVKKTWRDFISYKRTAEIAPGFKSKSIKELREILIDQSTKYDRKVSMGQSDNRLKQVIWDLNDLIQAHEKAEGTDPDKAKRLRLAKAKSKAIKIKLQLVQVDEKNTKAMKFKVGDIAFSEKHQQFFKIKKVSKSLTNIGDFIYDISSIERDKKAINMPFESLESFNYYGPEAVGLFDKFILLNKEYDRLEVIYDEVVENVKQQDDRDYMYEQMTKYGKPLTAIEDERKSMFDDFALKNKIGLNHSWGIAQNYETILKNKQ